MAEQGIAREPTLKDAMNSVHFVNSLAGVDALSVEILIRVGNRPGVYIEASLARINGCQSRASCALYAYFHTRLQNAVSRSDDILLRVNNRRIQRMCQGSYHPLRRPARELSIGIEGDHETNTMKDAEIAYFHGEGVILAAQQPIKVKQLTALALPPHPCSFARVVDAVTVEKEERPHALPGIPLIQFLDQVRT